MNYAEEIKQLESNIERLNQELILREHVIQGLEANINSFGLKCTICFEYMSNPCTISCGHTFCYHCLYKWDIIDHFIRIKSSDEEIRLEKKHQEFKAKSNPWVNFFGNSSTETKPVNWSTK
ncbi:18117_t:CDS:2, partial [Cetraspora pellucida]